LATFGAVLATIYYFKPQTVVVSTVFLAVIAYVLGEAMSNFIPRKTWLGRFMNPHPVRCLKINMCSVIDNLLQFNSKEHAAIIIMGSAACTAPAAIELLSVQKLFYNQEPNAAVGIFLVFASQCLGYGIAGLLRRTLVYQTSMLFPNNLPMVSLLEALHGEKSQVKKKLRVFYIGFLVLFFYEIIPEFIMPTLVGVSVFCLAKRDSLLFTNLFGGSNGNEGLGIMGLSFDWQYISNPSPLWYPLQTLFNSFVGYVLCVGVFVGVYYGNIWHAQDFPFLSQALYTNTSTSTNFTLFVQTAILDEKGAVDPLLLAKQGLPYFSCTFALYILATNLSITATFTHICLWNWAQIRPALQFFTLANLKHIVTPWAWNWRFWTASDSRGGVDDHENDPHYQLMLAYKDAPNWWYGIVLVLCLALGFLLLFLTSSTLPWWAYIIACGLSYVCILFFGAQYAMTGYQYNVQPVIQMIGGYLHPGHPMANMYFVLFGYNSVFQGQQLLSDLKFGQYTHLSPRMTFTAQMVIPIAPAF
jgi:OPT family oligopeptide transporter